MKPDTYVSYPERNVERNLRLFFEQMNHALNRAGGKTTITLADLELLRAAYTDMTGETLTIE